MTNEQALAIIKQPDNWLSFNQENIEALNTVIESVCKLQKIELIINEYKNGIDMEYAYPYLAKIREVLEKE